MRLIAALATTALLAACGANGAPERPNAQPGVSVSGDARIGVTGTL